MKVLEDLGLAPRPDRIDEVLAYNLAELYSRGSARLAAYLAPSGLTPAKWNALLAARYAAGGRGLSQKRLAQMLIVSDGNVTGLVDGLERQRLVERGARPGDRRVRVVRATPRGAALVARLWPGYLAQLRGFTGPLAPAAKLRAARLLERWRQGLRASGARPRRRPRRARR